MRICPGSTAPTPLYDVEFNDVNDVDLFGGELNNGDNATSMHAIPKIGNGYGKVVGDGEYTLSITNNSVNSATGEVIFYITQ